MRACVIFIIPGITFNAVSSIKNIYYCRIESRERKFRFASCILISQNGYRNWFHNETDVLWENL